MGRTRIRIPKLPAFAEPATPEIGPFLRHLRTKLGLTQEYIAAKIEVSRPTLNKIEAGKAEISLLQAKKLADFYNLPLQHLLSGRDSMQSAIRKSLSHNDSGISLKEDAPLPTMLEPVVADYRQNLPQEVVLYICSKLMGQPGFFEPGLKQLLFLLDAAAWQQLKYPFPGLSYLKGASGPEPNNWQNISEDMIVTGQIAKVLAPPLKYPFVKLLPLRAPKTEIFKGNELLLIEELIYTVGSRGESETLKLIEKVTHYQTAEIYQEIKLG